MLVKNLESWVGIDCNYSIGELIDLPDDVALARIDAGLCEAVKKSRKRTDDELPPSPVKPASTT